MVNRKEDMRHKGNTHLRANINKAIHHKVNISKALYVYSFNTRCCHNCIRYNANLC